MLHLEDRVMNQTPDPLRTPGPRRPARRRWQRFLGAAICLWLLAGCETLSNPFVDDPTPTPGPVTLGNVVSYRFYETSTATGNEKYQFTVELGLEQVTYESAEEYYFFLLTSEVRQSLLDALEDITFEAEEVVYASDEDPVKYRVQVQDQNGTFAVSWGDHPDTPAGVSTLGEVTLAIIEAYIYPEIKPPYYLTYERRDPGEERVELLLEGESRDIYATVGAEDLAVTRATQNEVDSITELLVESDFWRLDPAYGGHCEEDESQRGFWLECADRYYYTEYCGLNTDSIPAYLLALSGQLDSILARHFAVY